MGEEKSFRSDRQGRRQHEGQLSLVERQLTTVAISSTHCLTILSGFARHAFDRHFYHAFLDSFVVLGRLCLLRLALRPVLVTVKVAAFPASRVCVALDLVSQYFLHHVLHSL